MIPVSRIDQPPKSKRGEKPAADLPHDPVICEDGAVLSLDLAEDELLQQISAVSHVALTSS